MSVATDDVHDLFTSEEADESGGSVEEHDEGSDESGESAERTEFPSLEDEGSVDPDAPARDETAESTTVSSAEAVDDDTDEFGSIESRTMSFEGSVEDDTGEFEPAASSTSSDGSVEKDTDEFESAESKTSLEDDTEDSEPAASTTPSSEAAAENDTGESGSTATTATPEEAAAEDRDESEPEGPTASADGTTADDQGAPESGGTTTSTDGPPTGGPTAGWPSTDRPTPADHEESETMRPDEPESVASETAVASGTAVDEGMAAGASGSNRLPTGIDQLDRAMGGGVPPGRLVVLVADPGVQSELIVDSVLAQRDTLFVSTDRPDWEVMKDIEPGLGSGEVVIRDHTPDSLLSGLDSLLDELGTSSNFVIDSVNELELLPRKRYRIFLSDVKRRLFDTGSVGLLTGVTLGHESARDLTLRRADVVWRLETRTTDREIENRLSVPKFRGGAALTETVKLELTDEVRVDSSWNDA